MSLSIKVRGFRELGKSIKRLENEGKVARQQALNRTATSVRSAGVKATAAEMGGARQADIRKATKIDKASKRDPSATVVFYDRAIGIEKLRKALKVRKQRGRRAYQVSFKGRRVKRAFKIPELGGDAGKVIFRRTGPGRGNFRRVYGFTTVSEVDRGGKKSPIIRAMQKRGEETFPKEFDRAIGNRMRRAGF